MNYRLLRIVTAVLTGFVALTAIGGGITMLLGIDAFPAAWLAGTPFGNYVVPALILAVVVGGSALLSTLALVVAPRPGVLFAVLAGLLLAGFVSIEVLILKQIPAGPTPIELLYLGIGLLIIVAAAGLWRLQRR